MRQAVELQKVAESVAVWQIFDRVEHAEIFSCSALTAHGLVLFDPIRLSEEAFDELLTLGRPYAVAWTSQLTRRDADWFIARLGLKDPAKEPAALEGAGFKLISLNGATPGEVAYYHAELGLLTVGPAASYDGFRVYPLPKKLQSEPKLFSKSFDCLVSLPFKICCFARGMPIVGSTERLRLANFLASG